MGESDYDECLGWDLPEGWAEAEWSKCAYGHLCPLHAPPKPLPYHGPVTQLDAVLGAVTPIPWPLVAATYIPAGGPIRVEGDRVVYAPDDE